MCHKTFFILLRLRKCCWFFDISARIRSSTFVAPDYAKVRQELQRKDYCDARLEAACVLALSLDTW